MSQASRRLTAGAVAGQPTGYAFALPVVQWQIAGLIFLVLAATAWVRPLMLPDEGRYVGVAWEMMRSGDWLTPTLNGLPYFHKPPLFYWITASAMSLFGANEFAARAAPVLGAWIGCFALFQFSRRWSGERVAYLTLFALLAQPLLFVGSQFANLDMLVAGLITATILLLADSVLSLERGLPHRRALLLAYAAAAAGLLAKGLIGFVIPAMVIMAWLLVRGRWRLITRLISPSGLLLGAALAGPWFVAMQMRFPDFLDYFFVVQHFKRFAAGGFNNVQPFWFYPALLALFWLPCLPWLLNSLRRVVATTSVSRDSESAALRSLMLCWVVVVVAFFSLPQSKLVGYVLPALPPLAWLAGAGFARTGEPSRLARRGWLGGLIVMGLLGLSAVVALSIWPRPSSKVMAQALAARHRVSEPVLMLGHYDFDLPFYARLLQPVAVIDNWSSPEIRAKDNWRKEIADAGDFAPLAASSLLLEPDNLRPALCRARISWVIGATGDSTRFPFLLQAETIKVVGDSSLWRIDRGQPALNLALGCA